jgi:hypothetical protein
MRTRCQAGRSGCRRHSDVMLSAVARTHHTRPQRAGSRRGRVLKSGHVSETKGRGQDVGQIASAQLSAIRVATRCENLQDSESPRAVLIQYAAHRLETTAATRHRSAALPSALVPRPAVSQRSMRAAEVGGASGRVAGAVSADRVQGCRICDPNQWHKVSASSTAWRSTVMLWPSAFSAPTTRYLTEFLCMTAASAVAV